MERMNLGKGQSHEMPASGGVMRLSSEMAIDLERAVAGLPPGAREVFVMHDLEGYRYREIAELTGKALGTVKAHLHRARRLLRDALREAPEVIGP